jgi:hypothetical protein
VTGPERAARDAVLREIADELTTFVLDDVLPLAHRLRIETAHRLELTMTELACLDTLRRAGVILVLHTVTGCLHDVASRGALLRDARQAREGKRW